VGICTRAAARSADKTLVALLCLFLFAGRVTQAKAATAFSGWITRARDTSKGPPQASDAVMQPTFDDTDWSVVDLPHDASVEVMVTPNSDGPEGYVPAVQTFYRKHLRLPAAWATGTAITLEVDGAMTTSSWWVNGVHVLPVKLDGYLPTTLRLDTIPGVNLHFGSTGAANVIGVWTDNSLTTGWWYEGSGLVRRAFRDWGCISFLRCGLGRCTPFVHLEGAPEPPEPAAGGCRYTCRSLTANDVTTPVVSPHHQLPPEVDASR